MLNIPNTIISALKNGAQKNLRITFPNGERGDICNPNIIPGSVSFKESVCSEDSLKFGLSEASVFTFETVGIENITNMAIKVFIEVFCSSSVSGSVYRSDLSAYVYPIPYGLFIVDECLRQTNINHRKVTAYSVGVQSSDWNNIEKAKRNIQVSSALAYQYNPLYCSIASSNIDGRISGLTYSTMEDCEGENSYIVDIDDSTAITFGFENVLYLYSENALIYFEGNLRPWTSIEADVRAYYSGKSEATIKKILDEIRYAYDNPMSISTDEFDTSGGAITTILHTSKTNLSKGSYAYPFLTHQSSSTKGRGFGFFLISRLVMMYTSIYARMFNSVK